MKNKILRKIFAISCAIVLFFSVTAETLAKLQHTEKDATQAFGIAQRHASNYLNGKEYTIGGQPVELQYIVDGRTAYRVFAGASQASGDFETAIICLDKDGNFPHEPNSQNDGQYKSLGNIQESGIANKESLQWLVDNALIPEDIPEMQDQKIAEIFASLIESTKNDVNPLRVEDVKSVLTKDDIMIALQVAAWSVTNGYTMNNIKGNDGTNESSLLGNSIFGKNKGEFIKVMVEYYKAGMISHSSGNTQGTDPGFLNGEPRFVEQESDIFLGEFQLKNATKDYTINFEFFDGEGNKLEKVDYLLLNGNTTSSEILAPTKEDLNGKSFYIRLDRKTKARKVKITLMPKMISGTSVGTVWSTGKEGDQQLLSIEREPVTPQPISIEKEFEPTPVEYVYDAALRKHISNIIYYNKVTNTSNVINVDGTNSRKPVEVATPNSDYNEYAYEHRKDPLLLNIDDPNVQVIVVYTMTVYNEAKEPMIIKSITDYLPPKGLEFKPGVDEEDPRYAYNNHYGWVYNSSTNSVSTDFLKDSQIDGVGTDGKLKSEIVQIALDVTDEAKGRIVTNIAEISGYETVPAGSEDHDSGYKEDRVKKRKVILPKTEEEWENYNGYDNDDVSGSGYYKGQEDDDDFEKITVKGNMDIALRKNITHVNGKQVNPNRIGTIDVSPLMPQTDGIDDTPFRSIDTSLGATANYSADKKTPPVNVKAGDLVTYKIRLLNEGQVDMYATEVKDFLPDGLAFLPEYNDNVSNGWVVDSGGTLKSLAEVDINNQVTNSSLYNVERANAKAYVGPVVIRSTKHKDTVLKPFNKSTGVLDDSVFLQLTCLVVEPSDLDDEKILRNISVISKYGDSSNEEVKSDGTDSKADNIDEYEDFSIPDAEDDEDYDDVIITKEVNFYDLALQKYITKLTAADGTVKTIPSDQARNCEVVSVDALVNRSKENPRADATYSLKKDPKVFIEDGDIVTYTIQVFNEGTQDAVVKEIVDSLPKGLEFVKFEKNTDGTYKSGSKVNYDNGWEEFTENSSTGWTTGVRTIITDQDKFLIKAFDKTGATTKDNKGLSSIEVELELKVNLSSLSEEEKAEIMISGIKNWAEIKEDDGDDNDSRTNNKSQNEDDDDYDVIIPNIYDLALQKAVTEVIGSDMKAKTIPSNEKRIITVENTDNLKNRGTNGKANATYKINKELPVSVADGDYVIYTIRVFNEGRQAAKVQEVIDNVPLGLEFVPYETNTDGSYKSGSKTNHTYNWKPIKDKTIGWTEGYYSDYLKDKTIPAFDNSQSNGTKKEKGLSYEDVKIEFRVNLAKLTKEQKQQINKNGIENIAEITNDDGSDNDSDPDNKDPKEDDIDTDLIIPKEFDLALRKFIVETSDGYSTFEDRIPEVTYKNGTLTYNHEKDPVIVYKDTIITYCITVYNEGTQDGYAAEITDDIPKGLRFVKDSEINNDYRWVMYDANGKETNNPEEAVKIKTDYLSKEQESKPQENLIRAFDPSKEINTSDEENLNPDFRQVYVEFKVVKSPTEEPKVMINTAEISEDTDENGNPVEDVDSHPGNNDPEEDDIDTEAVEMKYFDLSLLKYVTKVYVTEDGVTKEIETGYNGLENPEPMVKIELNSKKLSTTEIKYLYTIKVTNEGEIEGYAKEITDRIPVGLAFVAEDNTEWGWKVSEDGMVTTDYTKDKLLKPGQSTEVPIVLRWVKDPNNMGVKVNVAEITEDENEFNIPDIDSTPNNNVDGEDDQDNALVMLTVTTGSAPIYLTLIISVMAILGTGSYLIWRYVLKRD